MPVTKEKHIVWLFILNTQNRQNYRDPKFNGSLGYHLAFGEKWRVERGVTTNDVRFLLGMIKNVVELDNGMLYNFSKNH